MKQLTKLFLLLLTLMLPVTANAYDFEVDGIYYYFTGDNQVGITNQGYDDEEGELIPSYFGNVTIPETVTYEGITYSVTEIGECAFYECSGLTSVTIPNSVTSIGDAAFYDCSGLTSVTIPNSVTSIGYSAFYGCSGLTSVTVPNSVTSIDFDTFSGCESLASVTIGRSVRYIDCSAFQRCSALDTINFNAINCADFFVPVDRGESENSDGPFDNLNISTINIGDGVQRIPAYFVIGCRRLTSLTIPNSVTSIGDWAFCGCSGLTGVTIPNSVTSIGGSAFYGCSGLTNVTIPNSVTEIGDYVFCGCSGLTGVTIPNSVIYIGDGAFCGCSGLTGVTIPNSVIYIGDGAFSGCSGLTVITVESGNTTFDSRNNCNAIIVTASNTLMLGCKATVIPNTVTSIGDAAFAGCSGLMSVTIPNTVTSIGDAAFAGCSGLMSVIIGNSVTEIGKLAFSGCSGLALITVESGNTIFDSRNNCNAIIKTAINTLIVGCKATVIPNSVTSIGNNAFSGCSGMTSVTIPNSVTSVGECAFNGCSALDTLNFNAVNCANFHSSSFANLNISTINIGDDVQSIPAYFAYCFKNLTSITIPNSVTSIGYGAFWGCSGLTSVIIPNSVTNIGYGAFLNCSGLNDVFSFIVDPTTVYMGYNVFYRYPNNYVVRTLHVPFGTSAVYQANTDWSQYFGSIVEMDPGATNNFSVPDMTVMQGDTVVIPVRLNNTESIISFQTDIFLPDGLEIVQEDGEYIIDASDRMTRTHSIVCNDIASGAIRVMCYSSNYKPFTGNSGDDLFYITVKVAEDAMGDYSILLRNTLFTNSDFEEIAAPDVMANVTVNGYKPGDANGSGTITVTDVVVTSQYVLEQNPDPFIFWAADVNADGNITVTDVSRIAWMVLNPSLGAPRRAPVLWNNGDCMSAEGITLAAGETRTVSIALDNEMDYSAFQLDLALPEDLTASNFRLTDRAGSHAFDVNMLANGKMRALCYSPTLKAICGNEGAVLTFDVTATTAVDGVINVDGIELVTTDCQTVRLDAFAIGVNSATTVSETVAGKTIAKVEYYNIAGQRLDQPENGVTLVVTSYTDGTRSTTKFIK